MTYHGWPTPDEDWDTLIWAVVYPQSPRRMREAAAREMVRRLGSPQAVAEAVRERLEIPAPIGTLSDCRPRGAYRN